MRVYLEKRYTNRTPQRCRCYRIVHKLPQDDGLELCREALENRTDKSVPTSFLIELLNICLKK